jgi:uncharacterized membrane protein YtjA (UPF0391 family)
MIWNILFLFLIVITALHGFLGLGFGQIEPAKTTFYISGACLLLSIILQRRKKQKKYYE